MVREPSCILDRHGMTTARSSFHHTALVGAGASPVVEGLGKGSGMCSRGTTFFLSDPGRGKEGGCMGCGEGISTTR